jgi:hypothetical protein
VLVSWVDDVYLFLGWFVGCLVGRSVEGLVGWLAGCWLIARLVGWMVNRLVAWLVQWLVTG